MASSDFRLRSLFCGALFLFAGCWWHRSDKITSQAIPSRDFNPKGGWYVLSAPAGNFLPGRLTMLDDARILETPSPLSGCFNDLTDADLLIATTDYLIAIPDEEVVRSAEASLSVDLASVFVSSLSAARIEVESTKYGKVYGRQLTIPPSRIIGAIKSRHYGALACDDLKAGTTKQLVTDVMIGAFEARLTISSTQTFRVSALIQKAVAQRFGVDARRVYYDNGHLKVDDPIPFAFRFATFHLSPQPWLTVDPSKAHFRGTDSAIRVVLINNGTEPARWDRGPDSNDDIIVAKEPNDPQEIGPKGHHTVILSRKRNLRDRNPVVLWEPVTHQKVSIPVVADRWIAKLTKPAGVEDPTWPIVDALQSGDPVKAHDKLAAVQTADEQLPAQPAFKDISSEVELRWSAYDWLRAENPDAAAALHEAIRANQAGRNTDAMRRAKKIWDDVQANLDALQMAAIAFGDQLLAVAPAHSKESVRRALASTEHSIKRPAAKPSPH